MTAVTASPPVVMAPRSDGCDVVWAVSRLARGLVQWRTSDGVTGESRSSPFGLTPQGEETLRVRVAGLPAGTAFEVRTVTSGVDEPTEPEYGDWVAARTLAPEAATAHIAAWNDTHERDDTVAALHAATPPVDMLVWNGDLCNDWKTPDRFTATVLNPAGLAVSDARPLAVVVGNHDVRGRYAYRFEEHIATADGRPYSAMRIGPVAVILLHTGEDKPDDHPTFAGRVAFEPLRAEQAAWLDEVTARPEIRDAPYRVVFCHIPLRWVDESPVDYDGEEDAWDDFSLVSREAWHEALVAWGAQVVVSGHTHAPAFLPATDEFPYAQLVSGGPDLASDAAEPALWLDLTADAASLRLVLRDLAGDTVVDVGFAPLT